MDIGPTGYNPYVRGYSARPARPVVAYFHEGQPIERSTKEGRDWLRTEKSILDRIHAIIQAGGGAVVALRLGSWWMRQIGFQIATESHGTTRAFGVPLYHSDDEYEIEPLDQIPE